MKAMGDVQAVLLTGGASRRMGKDKARIPLPIGPMAESIAHRLASVGLEVTVLGRDPIPGHAFLQDSGDFEGPLRALARFLPSAGRVFVCSCDLPLFDPAIVGVLRNEIGDLDAAIPVLEERPQPLCALYTSKAFALARELDGRGERRIMVWLDGLRWKGVGDELLGEVSPHSLRSANTPEELEYLLEHDRA